MNKTQFGRKDRLIQEKRHDVYQEEQKWPEPTHCSQCGALFVNGRWSWQEAPPNAYAGICPACRRIADRCPAGYVEITGQFLAGHWVEILNLVTNIEKQEKSAHPLERIMSISAEQDPIRLTTTGLHLARRIGEALSRAYKGDLSCQYADAEATVRISWQR